MNRTLNRSTNRHFSDSRNHLGFADYLMLLVACMGDFFARRSVRRNLRFAFGGCAFLTMLGVVGSIECGSMALLPGALICLALIAMAFLLLRGIEKDM